MPLLVSASRFPSDPALSRFQAAARDGRTLAAMTAEEAEQVLAYLAAAIEDEIRRLNEAESLFMISPGDSQVTARAVGYVRQHADCIQSNVIEHVMSGRFYGWARRRVHWAINAGLIAARRDENLLCLYPPGPGGGRRRAVAAKAAVWLRVSAGAAQPTTAGPHGSKRRRHSFPDTVSRRVT